MRVRVPWKGIRSNEGIVDELHLPQRSIADRNKCSGKSYGTTTGYEKTLSCRGEMVVVATSIGRD